MAGGGHQEVLSHDPAYVKYNNMAVDRYKHFRWTPRTAWLTIAYVVVVPSIFGFIGYKYEGKFDLRGKKRGDTMVEF